MDVNGWNRTTQGTQDVAPKAYTVAYAVRGPHSLVGREVVVVARDVDHARAVVKKIDDQLVYMCDPEEMELGSWIHIGG